MADPLKHLCPDGGSGNLLSDLKTLFSVFRNRKTKMFVYGFIFTFVACTVYIAFSPSTTNSSAPWFSSVFTADRSHFPTFISHFFSNSSSLSASKNGSLTVEHGFDGNETMGVAPSPFQSKKLNQTVNGVLPKPSKEANNGTSTSGASVSKPSEDEKKEMEKKEEKSNSTSGVSVTKPSEGKSEKKVEKKEKKSNSTSRVAKGKPLDEKKIENKTEKKTEKKVEFSVESMVKCNIFDGRWVRDDSYPLYAPGSCPHIDEPFNCYLNSRPDGDYQNYRWQPNGCNIPRLEGKKMLKLLRGKRLVFVGDSLNRNMWESLVCVLRNSVEDKSKVFEASGRREFRTEGSYSFVFKDYNCSVEFFRSPFLVQEWEMPENGTKHETLRLDLVERSSSKYKNADVIVFNTGHWWTHEKTAKGKDYYQEGSHIYGELSVADAFRKALTTWARWVDTNVDHKKSTVFFRGYSASHFRGGRWNSGGQCDSETEPITNETYLSKYPSKMRVLESVMKGMKTQVFYLNITRMTDYRKDAHPSIYRKQYLSEEERKSPLRFQDCSHWCLPGVPDTWNELLYAQLLIKQYENNYHHQQQQQQHQAQKGQ